VTEENQSDLTLTFDPWSTLTSKMDWPYVISYKCIIHFIWLSPLIKQLQVTEALMGNTLHKWILVYKIWLVDHIDLCQLEHGVIDLRATRPSFIISHLDLCHTKQSCSWPKEVKVWFDLDLWPKVNYDLINTLAIYDFLLLYNTFH